MSFEWAMIDGVNDRDQDVIELATVARQANAHVNLIPLNPTPGYPTLERRRNGSTSSPPSLKSVVSPQPSEATAAPISMRRAANSPLPNWRSRSGPTFVPASRSVATPTCDARAELGATFSPSSILDSASGRTTLAP
ncbi:MAG: hypothetical protein R2706_07820 [Acidimicrobiales bacterium]